MRMLRMLRFPVFLSSMLRFFKVGTWLVTGDNTWRYSCLDLQYMLDVASLQDTTLIRGQNHLVKGTKKICKMLEFGYIKNKMPK
jgi:hypothetical protein